MKIWTYILALTVIFLSVKPGIDTIPYLSEGKQATCCLSNSKCGPVSEDQTTDSKSDQEMNGVCNPFLVCCPCLLIQISSPVLTEAKASISVKQNFGYQSFISSKFISDFWQPPQFV